MARTLEKYEQIVKLRGIVTNKPATFNGAVNFNGSTTASSTTTVPAGGSSAAAFLITSGAVGIYIGSGAPTVSAAKGSLYLRTDGSSTSTRAYINTDGATTWTNVVTAA